MSITDGGGTGATAESIVSGGTVTGIAVTSAGRGYTNSPTILIAPPLPTTTALWPTVNQAMGLNLGSLSPYDNYQLEFARTPGGAWSDLGTRFTPTATTNTQYLNVSGNAGFFRVGNAP